MTVIITVITVTKPEPEIRWKLQLLTRDLSLVLILFVKRLLQTPR